MPVSTNQELAERVNISPSPCLRRVRKLEENRVIKRYVALLDPEAVGQSLQAFIEIRLEHQNPASVARFEAEVQKFVEVQESYLMTGEWTSSCASSSPTCKDYKVFT